MNLKSSCDCSEDFIVGVLSSLRIHILNQKMPPILSPQSTSNQKKMRKMRKKENEGVLDEQGDVVCYNHHSFHIQIFFDDETAEGYSPKDEEMFEKLPFCDAAHLQLNSCAIYCA